LDVLTFQIEQKDVPDVSYKLMETYTNPEKRNHDIRGVCWHSPDLARI
jgi:hypothetical protein